MVASFEIREGRGKVADAESKQEKGNEATKDQKVKTILFFGDSLTAGYGLRPTESFPWLIQEKIILQGCRLRQLTQA